MHLHYLSELRDRFEVAALCDLAPEALDHAGNLFPAARRLRDWRDLVAEPLDAVLLLTPGSHAPAAIAAAEAGLHVFAGKPMCFSIDEGHEMIAASSVSRRSCASPTSGATPMGSRRHSRSARRSASSCGPTCRASRATSRSSRSMRPTSG